jgi:hypothetical protein
MGQVDGVIENGVKKMRLIVWLTFISGLVKRLVLNPPAARIT